MSDTPKQQTTDKDTNRTSGPVLDSEEIQALMATVNPEESAEALFSTLQPLAQPENVEAYAFLSDDEGGPQRYPLFVNLQERFGENIKDMFSDLFQRDITIVFENMQQKVYRDIVRDERKQVFFAFEVIGMGRMLIAADLALIIATIDAMLGGEGEVLTDEDEEIALSLVELKLAKRIANHIIKQLEMLWLPVQRMEFKLSKIDTDPQFLAVAGSNDACFTVEFATQWNEETSGFIEIHYPRTFLEPMMETLRAAVSDEPVAEDEEWTSQIEESLKTVPVQLQLNLGQFTMTIDQFLSIKSGDYLPYTMLESDPATLCIERTPLFYAKPGEQNGMLAAELLETIDPNKGAMS